MWSVSKERVPDLVLTLVPSGGGAPWLEAQGFQQLEGAYLPPDFWASVRSEAEEQLAEHAAPLRARGLAVDTAVCEGYAATVIVEEAARRDADLIVIGTHGLSGLKHLLLGSIAERVVQKAPCPVLTVKSGKA